MVLGIRLRRVCQPHGCPVSVALCCANLSTLNTVTSLASPEQQLANEIDAPVLQPECFDAVV